MIYKYEFQSNFNNEIINEYMNKENVDEWGCALVTINDKYGAEYNLCIDDKDNESAIYFQEIDELGFWQTDYSGCKHYEIDFNNPNWEEDLEKEMKNYLLKELKENKDIYPF